MRFAEPRPGMNVIGHQLDRVAVNVVIQTDRERVDVIVIDLIRFERFPFHNALEFFRQNEIARLNIVAARIEIAKARRFSGDGASIDIFREIFSNQIERTDVQPGVGAPSRPLICSRQNEC